MEFNQGAPPETLIPATMSDRRKAGMSYTGGKGAEGTAQAIINQQPPHDTYIEPFAGHAAVFRTKRPALNNVLIDKDPDCTAWIGEHCNGNIDILTTDAIKWLAEQRFGARTLIYCDPPYLIRSRVDQRQRYRCEMTDEEHEKLLGILMGLPCMVQISSYADRLYSSYLRDWRHITFQSMTRGGKQTEHLWMSYPEPKALHTYTHLGKDYRERERIKRKVTRWTRRLAALPALERLALMSAINDDLTAPAASSPPRTGHLPHRAPASRVSILFVHKTTNYTAVPGADTWDAERDATLWPGGNQVVAHPPCAQWGRLRGMATPRPNEKALGPFAVAHVRRWGGVVEHPAGSTLWPYCSMPTPGQTDAYGGFTLDVDQVRWGHPAQKHTWLYVCGCKPEDVPALPPPGITPTRCVTSSRSTFYSLPALSKRGRELTPPALCVWLVELARRCHPAHPEAAAGSAGA